MIFDDSNTVSSLEEKIVVYLVKEDTSTILSDFKLMKIDKEE